MIILHSSLRAGTEKKSWTSHILRGELSFFKSHPADRADKYNHRLFVDYRHFDAANIKPRFEFGFGLSYTKFDYSGLIITAVTGLPDQDAQLEANWLAGQPGPEGVGASTALWLHRPAYTVSFTVRNSGNMAGTEVRGLFSFL